MRAAVIAEDPAQLLRELEEAVGADPDEIGEPIRCRPPYDQNPVMWTEWRCPACRTAFLFDLELCPHDSSPLEAVPMSQPFLWLG
jgi:hypothetical protein